MRIVLLALIFQVVSPVFFSVVTQAASFNKETYEITAGIHHTSIIAPLLLKEKDESETKIESVDMNFVTLIDFTDHTSALIDLHETKIIPFVFHDRIDHQPPLFTLNSVFII